MDDEQLLALEEVIRAEIVDRQGVADLACVGVGTVNVWKHRGILPEPLTHVGNGKTPIWLRARVITWLVATGRMEG